ncbi:GyrI-like domain-containing protein [Vibrio ostreicida]|uniref:GyrI-like domain-containing protein n=1 Tax=Vibrio ostreicida TaxID=526588 RepID=UPI00097084F1|nr:GyrI-like domain-containing protein [Vibrio ostreicida]
MHTQTLNAIAVTGYQTTTTNARERDPATAAIGQLWQKFSTDLIPKLAEGSGIYGLYTHYESDADGQFDVIACCDDRSLIEQSDLITTSIQAGHYLTFSASGEMPQAVIQLWEEIWRYFALEDCPHTRAYTTDFEHYTGQNSVNISIAIHP